MWLTDKIRKNVKAKRLKAANISGAGERVANTFRRAVEKGENALEAVKQKVIYLVGMLTKKRLKSVLQSEALRSGVVTYISHAQNQVAVDDLIVQGDSIAEDVRMGDVIYV